MLVQGLEALPLPLELMSVVALHGVGVGYDLRVDPLNFCHLWGYELVRSIIIMTHNRVGVNIIMSRTIPGTLTATWGEGQRCKKKRCWLRGEGQIKIFTMNNDINWYYYDMVKLINVV